MVKIQVDIKNFQGSIQQMARLAGVPLKRVIEYESGRIIDQAMKRTVGASAKKIRANHASQRAITLKRNRRTYFLNNRYPSSLWKEIEAQRKDSLKRKLGARGLSKQSWVRLAAAAGLNNIKAPAYVHKAKPRSGKTYNGNARVKRDKRPSKYAIFFENRQPTVANDRAGKGRRALGIAISGRQKYFERNLKDGVFKNLASVAKAYPGLIIQK